MKKFTLTILFSLFISFGFAQKVDDKYVHKYDVPRKDVFFTFDAGKCGDKGYAAGEYASFKIVSVIDDNTYEVVLTNNNVDDPDDYPGFEFAKMRNHYYCISKDVIETYFRKAGVRVDFGTLVVPFKLRFDPVSITAGGELGGFLGFYLGKSNFMPLVHAGFTFVSLNDANAEVPETKLGFTGGVGFVSQFGPRFEAGLISGIDLFEGVEDWQYKYSPWLSLQIGYSFTKRRQVPNTPTNN